MNTHNEQSHTEIEFVSTNAMEQAALLKARAAMARWRSADQLAAPADSQESGVREVWYAALGERLYEWISLGGLSQDGERQGKPEKSCVG
ncbi:MAG TPA: hypothetical protein VFT37_06750 [Telluria sp.]|nr:hypothetical protein [Telluria sp.]